MREEEGEAEMEDDEDDDEEEDDDDDEWVENELSPWLNEATATFVVALMCVLRFLI